MNTVGDFWGTHKYWSSAQSCKVVRAIVWARPSLDRETASPPPTQ